METKRDMIARMDSYESIVVVLSNRYYEGRSNSFYLRLPTGMLLALELKRVEHPSRDETLYRLAAPELEIGVEYQIIEEHARAVSLEYALIVKTKRFDEMFSYHGDDLGATYSKNQTKFALWAPTASAVKVEVSMQRESTFCVELTRTTQGVFRGVVHLDIEGASYVYLVRRNGEWVEAIDPYGISSMANHQRSYVIDTKKTKVDQHLDCLPKMESYSDAVIYEVSVRDYSMTLPTKDAGKYLGLVKSAMLTTGMKPAGFDYIKNLGVTHIQLMPVYDFCTVDEMMPKIFYNWGYDPVQWMVPEGSYSSQPNDPYARILELKTAIALFHKQGLRVIMDVVYNHFYGVADSSFDKIVPYYYFRRSESGAMSNGSFCGNDFDTGTFMGRKYIIDSCKMWIEEYGFDGFRFDLMGIIDVTTMNGIVESCLKLKKDCMFYGEGWDMPTTLDEEVKSSMNNHALLPGIAFFNDRYRDIVKGKTNGEEINVKGYASGDTSQIEGMKSVICGNAIANQTGLLFYSPLQSVNYVECHDNATCWDKLKECCKEDDREMRLAKQKLIIGILMVSQGIPFLHMGQEFCRTKNGVHNSYMSKDVINSIDWERKDRYQSVVEYTKDMIVLRKKFSCFRMQTRKQMEEGIHFETYGDNILVYRLACEETQEYDEIHVFINPTNVIHVYNLDGEFEVIANESGLLEIPTSTHRLLINPSTMVVIGRKREHNDGTVI